jgi:hypothetical protein
MAAGIPVNEKQAGMDGEIMKAEGRRLKYKSGDGGRESRGRSVGGGL